MASISMTPSRQIPFKKKFQKGYGFSMDRNPWRRNCGLGQTANADTQHTRIQISESWTDIGYRRTPRREEPRARQRRAGKPATRSPDDGRRSGGTLRPTEGHRPGGYRKQYLLGGTQVPQQWCVHRPSNATPPTTNHGHAAREATTETYCCE